MSEKSIIIGKEEYKRLAWSDIRVGAILVVGDGLYEVKEIDGDAMRLEELSVPRIKDNNAEDRKVVDISALLAELEFYRRKERLDTIIKRLKKPYLSSYDKDARLDAYEAGKMMTLIHLLNISNEEVDLLILDGFTFEEIAAAIKGWYTNYLKRNEEERR